MDQLTPNAVLRRAPDIKVHITSESGLRIYRGMDLVATGPNGLAILDVFQKPMRVADAIARLQSYVGRAQDWIDVLETLIGLYKAGILQDEQQDNRTDTPASVGWGSPIIQIHMLNDRARTAAFLSAIREVVRPGDVVVDIGTGTGVLAIAAAQAGAIRVYALEASFIGKTAQAVVESNGFGDRVKLLYGWSTKTRLPEGADVLVSEIIGDEPLSENVLETTSDAIEHLLTADARLIPSRVKVFGVPITMPRDVRMRHFLTPQSLRNWRSWYGIDFGPLLDVSRSLPHSFSVASDIARDWKTLSDPGLLADIDLKSLKNLTIDNATTVITSMAGRVDGVLIYFDINLSPTVQLSTHPTRVQRSNSWRNTVWVCPQPPQVRSGDCLEMTYRYRAGGARAEVAVHHKARKVSIPASSESRQHVGQ